ncbi:von Willebrand factor A domain-containing protein 7-like isoform X2 [Amphiura filiformis]|uniref:von Willebrand factor A domain-containing protein 7-like isoform X2 n=1 Tax=Amphiura filiformis TaxID=82378 RepID=UPI003B218263
MKIALAVLCAVIALIVSPASCFLNNRISYPNLPAKDYTLEDLTRETILQAVAKYLEDTNPSTHSPGDLTGLDPLTPSLLLKAHYTALGIPDCASSSNFEAAINEIVAANINLADNKAAESEYHFNAEKIPEGNARMINLRTSILTALASDSFSVGRTRLGIGKFLHLLQSFYSNTNWIESISMTEPYTELGYSDTLSYPTNTPEGWACRNCLSQFTNPTPSQLSCSNNLKTTTLLTSGYRSDQDVDKPTTITGGEGKCSHGGKFESSWRNVPIGGINKDSSDPDISPHYMFHQDAAKVAIKAGVAFFNDPIRGLHSEIGNDKFERLFNLNSESNALVLVIDDTGSMSEEIDAVIQSTIQLVNDLSNTCSAPSQYIISPFNDPGAGPVTDTADPAVAMAALNALVAHSGGDCPELCLTGIENALNRVNYPSTVYVWTDADDKDSDKGSAVTSLAMEKSATIEFVLTGACGGLRRRKKRAVSSSYTSLAEATGGTIYETNDAEVGTVSDIILADAQSGVSVLQWNNLDTSTSISVPVDNTMQGLSVTITGPSTPKNRITVCDPSGTDIVIADVIVDAAQVFSFLLDTGITGSWTLKLDVLAGQQYSVDVSTRSFVDFSFEILQERSGVFVPVEGLPTAESDAVFRIDVISAEIVGSIDRLVLHNYDGSQVLTEVTLSAVGGRTVGSFVANVTLPSEPFSVSILGTDTDGNAIQRFRPGIVQVFNFKLERNETLGDLVPGGNETLDIILINLGSSDTFAVGVSVLPEEASISVDVSSSIISLESLQATPIIVTFTADASASIGEFVTVTITMTSQTTGKRNFLTTSVIISQPYTVDIPMPVDNSEPLCTIKNVTNPCSLNMINDDCGSHRWSTQVLLEDDLVIAEYNISDYNEASSSESTTSILNPNTAILNYEANCCCPQVDFTIVDLVGNVQTCGLDFITPVEDEILDVMQCSDICAYKIGMVNKTANQISFSWSPRPSCSSDLSDEVQIYYKLLVDDQCREITEDLEDTSLPWTTMTSTTLSGLKPFSTYLIMVTTKQRDLGEHLPASLTHTTSQAAPVGVPANIVVTERNDNTILLSWDNIPCGSRGGVIQHYMYQLESSKEDHCNVAGNTTERSYNGAALTCKGSLKFRVAGVNKGGAGPYSDFVNIPKVGNIANRFSPGHLGNMVAYLVMITLYQLIK